MAETKISKNEKLSASCILTVSMGGPYDGNYFKFVAAVIEVSIADCELSYASQSHRISL